MAVYLEKYKCLATINATENAKQTIKSIGQNTRKLGGTNGLLFSATKISMTKLFIPWLRGFNFPDGVAEQLVSSECDDASDVCFVNGDLPAPVQPLDAFGLESSGEAGYEVGTLHQISRCARSFVEIVIFVGLEFEVNVNILLSFFWYSYGSFERRR